MARGFGGTGFGVGSTDAVTTTFTDSAAATRSYWGWIYINGVGGGSAGRIFDNFVPNTSGLQIYVVLAPPAALWLQRSYSTQDGIWLSTSALLTAGIHSFGISYSTGSNPIMYIDGVSVGVTNQQSAIGSAATTPQAVTIGNRSTGLRNWDGWIEDIAVWNVLLTASEFSALAKGARPGTVRAKSLLAWWPLNGRESPEPDFSGSKFNGTLTGTSFAPGPPINLITPRRPIFLPSSTAVAATPFIFTPAVLP